MWFWTPWSSSVSARDEFARFDFFLFLEGMTNIIHSTFICSLWSIIEDRPHFQRSGDTNHTWVIMITAITELPDL